VLVFGFSTGGVSVGSRMLLFGSPFVFRARVIKKIAILTGFLSFLD
jgi:hypothetical protein